MVTLLLHAAEYLVKEEGHADEHKNYIECMNLTNFLDMNQEFIKFDYLMNKFCEEHSTLGFRSSIK